jgi:hypothetical protein
MYGFTSRNIWLSLRATAVQGGPKRDTGNSREARETPSLGRLQRKRLQISISPTILREDQKTDPDSIPLTLREP